MKTWLKIFDFFSSIKLAVPLLLSIGIFLAVGTFYESKHGTQLAQKMVYHSPLASFLMILLVINLACAAIDRIPWKKHHIGFVLTHLGIIVMLLGAFITQQRGLDGMLYLPVDGKATHFTVDQTDFRIYQSFDGKPFTLLVNKPVDFDRRPPGDGNYEFKLVDDDVLKISKYFFKAIRTTEVNTTTDKTKLSALKFKMANPNVSVEEWIGLMPELPPFYDFGPALVTFIRGPIPQPPEPKNQIVISQDPQTLKLSYKVFSKKQTTPTLSGNIKEGSEIQTGWMGLKFKLTEYLPHAEVKIDYMPVEHDNPTATSVIKAEIGDRSSFFELDSPHEIKGKTSRYFVSFVRKSYDLGFKMHLKKFKMGLYGGSTMPSGYESTVVVNDNTAEPHVISMNEPLKYNGYTLYQSSFEQNERGEPIASILSVNYDPGRFMKYLGASCMVLGIITMFYFKPMWSRKKR